jgi:hypothetical protein
LTKDFLLYRYETDLHKKLWAMRSIDDEGTMVAQGGGRGLIRRCRVQPGGLPAVLKPLDNREASSYRALQETPLREVIPTFYGVHQGSLIIGDVTAGFQSACLADFKVGRRHYDPNAAPEKVARLVEKQQGSTTDSIGVRLIDAKVRRGGTVIRSWDRRQGLKFTEEELEDVVHAFVPQMLRDGFSAALKRVREAFSGTARQLPGFRMYSASVLVAYDGDAPKQIRVVLIDFAHTHISLDQEGYDLADSQFDDGVLDGIAALVTFAEVRAPLRRGTTVSLITGDQNRHKKI